jgi:hypothetical protein
MLERVEGAVAIGVPCSDANVEDVVCDCGRSDIVLSRVAAEESAMIAVGYEAPLLDARDARRAAFPLELNVPA